MASRPQRPSLLHTRDASWRSDAVSLPGLLAQVAGFATGSLRGGPDRTILMPTTAAATGAHFGGIVSCAPHARAPAVHDSSASGACIATARQDREHLAHLIHGPSAPGRRSRVHATGPRRGCRATACPESRRGDWTVVQGATAVRRTDSHGAARPHDRRRRGALCRSLYKSLTHNGDTSERVGRVTSLPASHVAYRRGSPPNLGQGCETTMDQLKEQPTVSHGRLLLVSSWGRKVC